MRTKKYFLSIPALLVVALVTIFGFNPAIAQKKLQVSPGGYHGELDFPISWKRYYSYAEWTKIMQDLAKQYPQLADISSIGKSRMGRTQYLLTITAKSTGKAEEKTAMWVDGAIHGNEINGITCALYTAWYLLIRYDYDPYVYDLLNTRTFYILPGLNVDANDSYASFPNTANNPREPYRMEDNDGDGLYDEDRTEDVDGDGEISVMWKEDPAGDYKLSADKRRFIRITDPNDEARRFRRIGEEGYDNDGDGRINEDDIGGPDPNRNFPYGWELSSSWPYPLSESETRNVFEFQRKHPNIFATFHFHNTGRLIMFAAPPDSRPATITPEQRQQADARVAQQLQEMRKADKYAQLFTRTVTPEYQTDMDTQTAIVTQGARILKDYTPTISGLSGQAQSNAYFMLGTYSYLIELWGSAVAEADLNGDGRVDDDEYMKWIDTELTGEGWITPHKYNHPDLGEIWIGSTAKKHVDRTPPARYMETEALKQANFILYCASQFPKVEVGQVTVTPATGDLYWVDVAVKNDHVYPSSSDRAVLLKTSVNDKLTVSSSDNVSIVELPAGAPRLDAQNPASAIPVLRNKTAEFRLRSKDARKYRCLVKMTGAEGWVEFNTISKYGGKDKKRITIKNQ
jgi:hypothetical protein